MDMIICGLSMEMQAAEETGTVGKCISCYYLDSNSYNEYLEERKKDMLKHYSDKRRIQKRI